MDKSDVKGWGSTPGLLLKLWSWSAGEASGIPSVDHAARLQELPRNIAALKWT